MDILSDLKVLLENDRKNLQLSIERAKEARDKAPSAMESHSDSSRSQNEKLVDALEYEYKVFIERLKLIPDKVADDTSNVGLWSLIKINNGSTNPIILLVPEGFGGKKIGNITTITINAPLGKVIYNKRFGEKYTFQDKDCTIEKISL
jgi:hypothetical protein